MGWGEIVGSAIGSLIKSGGNVVSSRLSYNDAKNLQQRQFDFVDQLSSTAHQREVADLNAAGLNPILSVMGGSGAQMGNAGISSAPQMTNIGSDLSEGISTGAQLRQLRANTKNINTNTKLTEEQAETEQTKRENINADTIGKQTNNYIEAIRATNYPKWIKNELIKQANENNLIVQQGKLASSTAQMNLQNTENLKVNNEMMNRINKWERKHRKQWGMTHSIGGWTGSIGNILSGAVNYTTKGK